MIEVWALHMKGLCGCVGNVGAQRTWWVCGQSTGCMGATGLLISLGLWSWQVIGVGAWLPQPLSLQRPDVFWQFFVDENSHREKQVVLQPDAGCPGSRSCDPDVCLSGVPSWPLLFSSLVPGRDAVPYTVCLQHRHENGGG